ncbi:NADH-quinone oxidoreductase subunit L [bacterium]|nr:NADH-quinone oxidoreductase subunit L [bacterium]
MIDFIWLMIIFPLVGTIINLLFGSKFPRKLIHTISCGAAGLSFLHAILAFFKLIEHPANERIFSIKLFSWILSGDFSVDFSFLYDPLSAVMTLVVTGVGFLIYIYSIGYMHHDPYYHRYFAFLNLFSFSMLTLVLADNFLLLYVGWELVGLCSYFLIGFWFHKESASQAGKKAFITNRFGDFGFALGIFFIFVNFGTLNYHQVFTKAPDVLVLGGSTAIWITLLLFVGATGKSAQIPLHVWLPDAMEGPTPVSALIHAATMVTAGVYMVARCSHLFILAPQSMLIVAGIGVATAIFAASIGLVQNDIKRVLAYSTVSQLGYMFLGVGVGAFAAGIFHLVTHAFFKALLFLCAGSVMHALSDELDMQKMGGLRKKLPITFVTFTIGGAALCGIPLFSGFFSKDEILWKAFSSPYGNPWLWAVGVLAAGLTAFYTSRLIFNIFFGESRVDPKIEKHIHESPRVMTVPLIMLAVLAIVGGYIGIPHVLGGHNNIEEFLAPSFPAEEEMVVSRVHHSGSLELAFMLISILVIAVGIAVAYIFYIKDRKIPKKLAEKMKPVYDTLKNKYYIDEIYDFCIIKPVLNFAQSLYETFDMKIIDGVVNGTGKFINDLGGLTRKLQTGKLSTYFFSMLVGALFILGMLSYYIYLK